jgi:hypothetical protein
MDLVIDVAGMTNQNSTSPICQAVRTSRKGGFAVSTQSVQGSRSTDRITLNTARRVFWICFLCSLLAPACAKAKPPLPGGFSEVKPDQQTQAVANFAVGEISKKLNEPLALKDIVSAERQVVAGWNYRFELNLTKNNQPYRVRATVWHRLDGAMELTSWNPI